MTAKTPPPSRVVNPLDRPGLYALAARTTHLEQGLAFRPPRGADRRRPRHIVRLPAGRAGAGKGRAARPRPAANLARLLPRRKARLPQDRTHRRSRTPPSEGQTSRRRKKDRRSVLPPRHARKPNATSPRIT